MKTRVDQVRRGMSTFKTCLLVGLVLPCALSMKVSDPDAKPHLTLATVGTTIQAVAEMEKVFARSEEQHQLSMDKMSKSLTLAKSIEALEQRNVANSSSLDKITSLLAGNQHLRVATHGAHDGFGGLDGARKLLNSMIFEAMAKYDAEIAKCTEYYASQCALMETARGQISAANFVAATSRSLILDAQGNINKLELAIPETKQELKDHNSKCKAELSALNKRLKIVMGDIAVMTMILKMSDCDAKLIQTERLSVLRCENQCTQKSYISFNHTDLQKQVDQLRTPAAQDLMSEGFADMFNDEDADVDQDDDKDEDEDFLQVDQPGELGDMPPGMEGMLGDGELPPPNKKKAEFNRKPVPKTKVPGNPCTDPNKGAPSAANKRAAKCTLKKSPQCYKLQGRFLQIQAEIADVRDELMDQIASLESDCTETKNTLESSIENDNAGLASSQTKLAAATEKEASAGEEGRQVAKENAGYNADLVKQMKICSTNYVDFETELCALKKIRGDLFKKMKPGHKGFFQDCELSPWTPEACTKKCAGGDQKLIRSVLVHPNGGSKCLPLKAEKGCNHSPCPVDCVLKTWSGWSKCSSKCGGGVKTRVRDVKVPMKHKGKPCGGTTQTTACNVAACSKACVLHAWTKWTSCSKDCDGGTKKRQRMIKEPAEGSGECAGEWSKARLQYRPCAAHRCKVPNRKEVMKCNQTLDILLLLDGTPKSGKKGWAAEVKAANLFVDAFQGPGVTAKPNFAIIHYTGPRTWSGVSKCTGKSKKKVDMEKTCKIKLAQHFSSDLKKTKGVINGLEFAPGSKLLSLALMTVEAELALGNPLARTVVIVFIDGHPLSYRKTKLASRSIRKKARLVYVPVIKFSPLADLKKWASRRWQENIVAVKSYRHLASASTGTHIIANICPKKFPKLKNKKR